MWNWALCPLSLCVVVVLTCISDKAKSVPDPNDDENVKYSSFPIKTTKPEVPKPTKTIAKVKGDQKGQTKLFQFFSQTTTNGKKVLQNSPAPPPT